MNETDEFTIVRIGMYIFPIIVFVVLFFTPKLIKPKFRAFIGVLVSWVFIVLYTIYIYNPSGIAAGHELGMHFPEGKYDNNTISVALIGGWIYPTILAFVYLGGLSAWKKLSKAQ